MSNLKDLFDAARRHGETSEPDMEVGDLQGLLIAALQVMDEPMKERFYASWQVTDLLENWGEPEWSCEDCEESETGQCAFCAEEEND